MPSDARRRLRRLELAWQQQHPAPPPDACGGVDPEDVLTPEELEECARIRRNLDRDELTAEDRAIADALGAKLTAGS